MFYLLLSVGVLLLNCIHFFIIPVSFAELDLSAALKNLFFGLSVSIVFLSLSALLFKKIKVSIFLSWFIFGVFLFFMSLDLIHQYLFTDPVDAARLGMLRINWKMISHGFFKGIMDHAIWIILVILLLGFLQFFIVKNLGERFKYKILFLLVCVFSLSSYYSYGHMIESRSQYNSVANSLRLMTLIKQTAFKDAGLFEPFKTEKPKWLVVRKDPLPAQIKITQKNQPNVLVVLLESTRADRFLLGKYPRETLPQMREIFKELQPFVFRHAFSNASASYFSMISMTTGNDFSEAQGRFESYPLIWDYFKQADYNTFMITQSVGYPIYLLDQFFQSVGLDFYQDIGQEKLKEFYNNRDEKHNYLIRKFLKQFYEEGGVERSDHYTLEKVQEKLNSIHADEKFFGLWELECLHFPYCYEEQFNQFHPSHQLSFSKKNINVLINDYDNALLNTDFILKQFFDWFRKSPHFKNTIIVLASDHGEVFYEHGRIFHGYDYYLEDTHVPLFLFLPEAVKRRLNANQLAALTENQNKPVSLVDLMPTLLSLSGIQTEQEFSGAKLDQSLDKNRKVYISNAHTFTDREWVQPQYSTIDGDFLQKIVFSDGRPSEEIQLEK